jgi:hypothetical protein
MFLHELGHLLGLGHSDRPASILYANPYHPERGYMRNLKGDDIAGCVALYGASGKARTALAMPLRSVLADPNLLPGESVRIVVTDAENLDLAAHQNTLPANSARVRVAVQFALTQATARQRIELIAPDGSLYDYIDLPNPNRARGWTWFNIPQWSNYGALTLPGTWNANFLAGGQLKATQSFQVPPSRGSLAQLPDPLVNLHPRDDGGVRRRNTAGFGRAPEERELARQRVRVLSDGHRRGVACPHGRTTSTGAIDVCISALRDGQQRICAGTGGRHGSHFALVCRGLGWRLARLG